MFTSSSLRAIRFDPPDGSLAIDEQRLDEVVHLLQVQGEVTADNAFSISGRLDAALRADVRWVLVDLTRTGSVSDELLPTLIAAARVLRSRGGELIVAGAEPSVGERLERASTAGEAGGRVDERPALAATSAQALMILKMLRPKTTIAPIARSSG